MLRVVLMSIMVNDQVRAENFYTNVLGFKISKDIPVHGARWLTVVPPDDPDGPELVLEPTGIECARVFQKALYESKIPLTVLGVDDIEAEYERLKARGVKFMAPPSKAGKFPSNAVFDDTCGNYIMISEAPKA